MRTKYFFPVMIFLLFFWNLKGQSSEKEITGHYTESFESIDVSKHDFAPVYWGHLVESFVDYEYGEEFYVEYQHHTTGGWDGKGYLEGGSQTLGQFWTTEDVNDLLVSPQVSGTVSFYVRKTQVSGTITLYACTHNGQRFVPGEELKPDPMPELTTEWQKVTLQINEPTYIGFRLDRTALDEFYAESAVTEARRSLEIVSVEFTGETEIYANEENMAEITLQVVIRNTGDATLNPGDENYQIAMFCDYDTNNILAEQPIECTLTPGQSSEAIRLTAQIPAGSEKKNIRYDVLEKVSNTTRYGQWITTIPYLPILRITDAQGQSIDKPLDFEIVKEQPHSLGIRLSNEGGAPLLISNITLPEGFNLSESVPMQLAQGEKKELTLSLTPGSQQTGDRQGNIEFIYNDNQSKAISVCGYIVPSNIWYEDFENGIPTNFICDEQWTMAQSETTELQTVFNKQWVQNNLQSPLTSLISPKMHVNATDSLVIYVAKRTGYGGELTVSYSPDRRNWTEARRLSYNAQETENRLTDEQPSYNSSNYLFKRFVIKNIPAGEYYLNFQAGFVFLDNIYGFETVSVAHDLYAEQTDMPDRGTVNYPYCAEITLRNLGSTVEKSDSYTVELYANNEKVAQAAGKDIQTGESCHLALQFTPHQAGNYRMKILIKGSGFETTAAETEVQIEPETSTQKIPVGERQDFGSNVPLRTNYKQSISETVYTKDRISLPANTRIHGISYPYYSDTEKNFPVTITVWMENTDDGLFESEEILPRDTTAMSRLYKGTWALKKAGKPDDPSELTLTFDQPFVYTGNNLRIVLQSAADDYTTAYFGCEKTASTAIIKYSDTNLSEASWSKADHMPVCNLHIEQEVKSVHGTVTDKNNGAAMSGILVRLTSGDVLYQSETDEQGRFSIPVFQSEKTYTLTIEAEGYEKYSQEISFENGSVEANIGLMQEGSSEPVECKLTLTVKTTTGESAEGASVNLRHNDFGLDYGRKTIGADGKCTYNIISGTHTITIEKEGFKTYRDEALLITGDRELTLTLEENIVQPYALNATLEHDILNGNNQVTLSWNQEAPAFFDDFESYEDFAINFGEWTGIDGDQEAAAALSGQYKNRGTLQYATICNPLTVTPPWWYDYPVLRAYSGQQYAGFIRTRSGKANDDWLISPKITVGTAHILRFMAKAGDQFKERFQVGISTGGTEVDDFTIISGGNYETVGYAEWQAMEYDLSAYEGQEIYIAIHYISQAYFMLMIDDFYVGPADKQPSKALRAVQHSPANPNESFEIYLNGEKVAETDQYEYVFDQLESGTYTLGVKATYQVGESDLSVTEIVIPGKENYASVSMDITTNNKQTIDQESVHFTEKATGKTYLVPIEQGKAHAASMPKGKYLTEISVDLYDPYQQETNIDNDLSLEVELKESLITPYNLTVDVEKTNSQYKAIFRWNQDLGFSDSFETYPDFSTSFGEWTTLDRDNMPVYPIALGSVDNIVTFPGSGTADNPVPVKPMVFNPYETKPSMKDDPAILAPDGKKTVIFFSSQRAESDDWLISPIFKIREGYVWQVLAKAYAMYPEYIEFGISASKDPDSFTILDRVLLTEKEWTQYTIDLSDYKDQDVYLGIHYVTNDGFLAQIDAFYVGPDKEVENALNTGHVKYYEIMLDNVLVGQTAENSYVFETVDEGEHTASVTAVYESGKSETATLSFNTATGIAMPEEMEPVAVGRNGYIDLHVWENTETAVYSIDGQCISHQKLESGQHTVPVHTGIYIVQFKASGTCKTCKVQVK